MNHLKEVLWIVLAAVLFLAYQAFGAEAPYVFSTEPSIQYDFQVINISPGFTPVDLTDKGKVLTNSIDPVSGRNQTVLVQPGRNGKPGKRTVIFDCPDISFVETFGSAVNNRNVIVGNCADNYGTPGRTVHGFVRYPSGAVLILDFPGADGTIALGITDRGGFDNRGIVVGQFFGPLRDDHGGALNYRFHCFTWDGLHYRQFDFLRDNTYVSCPAANSAGQILMEFNTVDLQNNPIEDGYVIVDNGQFRFDFDPDFNVLDLNELGQALVQRDNGEVCLFDDGICYTIEGAPVGARIRAGRMNNLGEFVGLYTINGIPPNFAFIAKPVPIKQSR